VLRGEAEDVVGEGRVVARVESEARGRDEGRDVRREVEQRVVQDREQLRRVAEREAPRRDAARVAQRVQVVDDALHVLEHVAGAHSRRRRGATGTRARPLTPPPPSAVCADRARHAAAALRLPRLASPEGKRISAPSTTARP